MSVILINRLIENMTGEGEEYEKVQTEFEIIRGCMGVCLRKGLSNLGSFFPKHAQIWSK